MRVLALGLVVAGVMTLSASASASSIVYVCADGANLCRVDPGTGAQTQLTTDGQPGTSNVYGGRRSRVMAPSWRSCSTIT
jgi:hypothetical protein